MADDIQDDGSQSPSSPEVANDVIQGMGGSPPDTGDELSTLRAEHEQLKERFAGSTRSWQEEKIAREKAEAELKKYDKYKEVIDWSELDQLLESGPVASRDDDTLLGRPTDAGQGYPQSQTDPQIQAIQNQLSQLSQRNAILEIERLKNAYLRAHPEHSHIYNDPELHKMAREQSTILMQQEVAQNGRITSSPEQVIEYGVNRAVGFSNRLRLEGAKSVSEKREKIESSGADLGGGERPGKSSAEEEDDRPLSRDGYMGLQRQIHSGTKRVIPPDKVE